MKLMDGVDEVGGGFGERVDGVGAGGGAGAKALDLREDEPDPVGGLALLAEFAEDFGVDGVWAVRKRSRLWGSGMVVPGLVD